MLVPQFLDGPEGRLLLLASVPDGPGGSLGAGLPWVMIVPPLLEELNKSRRTLALLGAGLAARGIGCLVPDLFGTGDSEGEMLQGSWEIWHENLSRVHAWVLEQGASRVDLVALRGGALLAWDWLGATGVPVRRLALWQPVWNGRQLVNQLFRLRLAGGLMGRDSGETAAGLRARLAREGWIEIAGYGLSAALLGRLEGTDLGRPSGQRVEFVDWYQSIASAGQPIPPPVTTAVGAWSAAGIPTELVTVVGDAFWATQEIVEGKSLVDLTIGRLASRDGVRAQR